MQSALAKKEQVTRTYEVGDRLAVISGDFEGAIVKILGQPKAAQDNTYRCEVIGGKCEQHFISVEETDFDPESLEREA